MNAAQAAEGTPMGVQNRQRFWEKQEIAHKACGQWGTHSVHAISQMEKGLPTTDPHKHVWIGVGELKYRKTI